jgi:PAS domain S-box-containing protein
MAETLVAFFTFLTTITVGGAIVYSHNKYKQALLIAQASMLTEQSRYADFVEALLFGLFDSLENVGLAYVGISGEILKCNDAFRQVSGWYEADQVDFQSMTHKDDLEADLLAVKRLVKGDIKNYTMKKRYVSERHGPKWVRIFVTLKRCRDGTPDCFVVMIRNLILGETKKTEVQYG